MVASVDVAGDVHEHEDRLFWDRMNSPEPEADLPGMSSSEMLPDISTIEIIVATSAGKPLFHFNHCCSEHRSHSHKRRPHQQLVSLAAACVAFQHATHGQVRTISLPDGLILSTTFGPLHIIVMSANESVPTHFLVSLANTSIAVIHSLLSSAFSTALETRPHLDFGSHSADIQRFAFKAVERAIIYPLPASIPAVVSMPSLPTSSLRCHLRPILTSQLDACPYITHLVLFAASPPFPHRVIASASPVYSQLSPLDHLLLSSFLPVNTRHEVELPERVFLQTHSFNKASKIFARPVELRLDPTNYADFRRSVGGERWRPEWTGIGGDAIWVVAVADIAQAKKQPHLDYGERFLDRIEAKLDRSTAAKDIMVSMQQPFKVSDMFSGANTFYNKHIRGVLFHESQRIVGTVGVFNHLFGLEAIRVVEHAKRAQKCEEENQTDVITSLKCKGVSTWAVANTSAVVFLEGNLSHEKAEGICVNHVFPWLSANVHILFSKYERIKMPPRTLMANFLAPFES